MKLSEFIGKFKKFDPTTPVMSKDGAHVRYEICKGSNKVHVRFEPSTFETNLTVQDVREALDSFVTEEHCNVVGIEPGPIDIDVSGTRECCFLCVEKSKVNVSS